MDAPLTKSNALGAFLRDRRCRLDAAAFGLSMARRRTPGLRREEVAQRANVSVTWYTWLEQGRGGNPSAEVLDRIAGALTLTAVEREHLFLIGLGRPPEVRYHGSDPITPRLQRLLDTLALSPAIVRTATWDVVAWNRAAAAVLADYGKLPPDQRNILRMMFCDPRVRAKQRDWDSVARFVVASFRIDAARAGADAEVTALVEELSQSSPDFAAMWRDSHVQSHGDGVKQLLHPQLGPITLEYSSFAVDGRADLSLIVYNPATPADRKLIEALIEALPV
ncbi:MAG TPA: helix-turn-helix transcriptional regulator [Rhodopseudomonas sp.]|uniref:helix-turn-helix transcriptional regulator n=1 Tax=Rhodopseudomonas sp. TaxID=1078 RepID=UPI002EDAE2AD